jgi:hypothetical protein
MGEAEKVSSEALATYRKLAAANPDVYLPDVARTLTNLGFIYSSTQRMGEAEKVHSEALVILAKQFAVNPAIHKSALMGSMLHLGLVKLRIPGGRAEACQIASEVRRLGLSQVPDWDWAKELAEACPAN